MTGNETLIPKHGGYRKLKSFQVAQLVYDLTARFCDRYVDRRSRTCDQMVQAARSGVQNIAEGSQASGTSKKAEMKLTGVARASLEELRLDYEDFLRQRGLRVWDPNDPLWRDLIARKCVTADDVALWVKEAAVRGRDGRDGHNGRNRQDQLSAASPQSMTSIWAEFAANAALALIVVACSLLDRQIAAQARAFEAEGGFTERLYRVRAANRNSAFSSPSIQSMKSKPSIKH
ncbi:MAG: four helix bundle protein [Chloroflexi bacterium]|nr:four helix bundle protein [Chloroflexota bacterium]